MKNRILMAVGVILLASGCETLDPYTGESQMSKSTKGALIGAASGAVIGLASGDDAVDRRQRALIGAGVGALVGDVEGPRRHLGQVHVERRGVDADVVGGAHRHRPPVIFPCTRPNSRRWLSRL